jgi:integrase
MDRRASLPGRAIFCTLAGRPLYQNHVRQMMARRARKAGMERPMRPHGLRHAFAADLARRRPVNVIRDALGHSTLATTDRYLRDVAPREVIEAMQAGDWQQP